VPDEEVYAAAGRAVLQPYPVVLFDDDLAGQIEHDAVALSGGLEAIAQPLEHNGKRRLTCRADFALAPLSFHVVSIS
jgi:hypothetical protein